MKLTINIKKSIEQNASDYFEKSKKSKKKIETVKKVIESQKKKLEELKKGFAEEEKTRKVIVRREKAWYEKFHWFLSSDNLLVIGGRDATTNEIVVKKYTDKNDLVFHTEMAGSPFVTIKSAGKIPEATIREAASVCAAYSRAWKIGISPDVFYVAPEQVTKTAKPGEYIARGAFMIYGKKNFVKDFDMRIAVGIKEGQVIGGPITAVQKHAEKYVIIVQGDVKKSDLAKQVKKEIGGDLDEIMLFLPGDGKIIKK